MEDRKLASLLVFVNSCGDSPGSVALEKGFPASYLAECLRIPDLESRGRVPDNLRPLLLPSRASDNPVWSPHMDKPESCVLIFLFDL